MPEGMPRTRRGVAMLSTHLNVWKPTRGACTGLAAVMVSMLTLGASAAPLLPLHTGDINNDGARDVSDISCYTAAALANAQGAPNPACQAFSDADVDLQCDGSIDITDVQRSILIVLYSLTGDATVENLLRLRDPDFDLWHNGCDDDDDGDGFPDVCETNFGTDPLDPSSIPSDPNACTRRHLHMRFRSGPSRPWARRQGHMPRTRLLG